MHFHWLLLYPLLWCTFGAAKFDKSRQTVILADYEPKDSLEARLCLQAHTLYTQGLKYLSMAENCNTPTQSDLYMKNALKLLRLHNETIEVLNRHRRGARNKL